MLRALAARFLLREAIFGRGGDARNGGGVSRLVLLTGNLTVLLLALGLVFSKPKFSIDHFRFFDVAKVIDRGARRSDDRSDTCILFSL